MIDLEQLLAADIGVHTDLHGGTPITYAMQADTLGWIASRCSSEMSTLETGCGLSTAVFASSGSAHTCISPFPSEFDRVARWCAQNGISTDRVTYHGERSDVVLPSLEVEPLDLAVIDGSHSFPQAFVDFFYIAMRMREGGIVLIDDLQLWTGLTLRNFLAEGDGWEEIDAWPGRAVAFRMSAPFDPMQAWEAQPFIVRRSANPARRLSSYVKLVQYGNLSYAAARAGGAARRRLAR